MSWFRAHLGTTPVVAAQLLIALLGCGLIRVFPQRLAFRHYDVSDGLISSRVRVIYQDSKDYLWFGTTEGLSRFDGQRFTNYDTRDGLDHSQINTILEDRQEHLWVGTNGGGVARLVEDTQPADGQIKTRPKDRKKFTSYRVGESRDSNRVDAMLFDEKNTLWCATDGGFFRSVEMNGDLKFELVVPYRSVAAAMAAVTDGQGHLWFGYFDGLIEVVEGHIFKYPPPGKSSTPYGSNSDDVNGMVLESEGKLLVCSNAGVFEFVAPTIAGGEGQWKQLPIVLAEDQNILSISSEPSGVLWIGTTKGLIKYEHERQTLYTANQGLSDSFVHAVKHDRDGNLWIGTWSAGVCKLSGDAIINFTTEDGLPNQNVKMVVESLDGRIYVLVDHGVAELANGKASPISGWPIERTLERGELVQDRQGDWWMGAYDGLFHYKGPELQFRRGGKLGPNDGVFGRIGLAVYADSSGTVWASTESDLYRFDKGQKARLVLRNERTVFDINFITGDRSGDLWLVSFRPDIRRWSGGKTLVLQPDDGLPATQGYSAFVDSRGWLWIGLHEKGVAMTMDPAADRPKFITYSTENGLSGDNVRAITEDDLGRVYLATGHGLDQFDVATGHLRQFTTADGLAGDAVNHCMKDSRGYIWVSTNRGLSRLDPRALRVPGRPPSIFLSRVQVEGNDLPLPERGASRVPQTTLSASQNNMLIEYVGVDFQSNQPLRYQHKLEGVDTDWSTPTEQRSINYARLAPASYRLLVRAINQEGIASSEPAVIEFRILPPFWQRGWFLSSVAVLAGLIIYAAHRRRVGRLLELERVRTRIATDLHDDIGSNLSQIALLSEVVRQQIVSISSPVNEKLVLIADTARETVESMRDIVWAINPQRDRFSDLAGRMRRFADDTLGARDIALRFIAAVNDGDTKLGTDVRREVFLIFKEAINNVVRHSNCREAEIKLQTQNGWLVLQVSDDGQGFYCTELNEGQGLSSMRERATRLGGQCQIMSNGKGTTITLRTPLDGRA